MKILIPTDFSENALLAADFAAINFKDHPDVEFTLLHVIKTPQGGYTNLNVLDNELRSVAGKHLSELENELYKKYPGVEWDSAIEFGFTTEVINDLVDNRFYDLVIVGATGQTGFLSTLLGSQAQKIMKDVEAPIVVVPHEYKKRKVEHVMFATDFCSDSCEPSLNRLADILKAFRPKVNILHVSKEDDIGEEISSDFSELSILNDHQIDYTMHFEFDKHKEIAEVLMEESHQLKSDLIAVVPHHYNFFKSLFHDSVSKDIALRSDVPVLLVK